MLLRSLFIHARRLRHFGTAVNEVLLENSQILPKNLDLEIIGAESARCRKVDKPFSKGVKLI